MPTTDCGIIILAAGNSSRLGMPKQLLTFENKTLLQRVADEALASGIGDIVVVTGFNHHDIASSSLANTIHFVYNELWEQGMASSVGAGLSALLTIQPHLHSVIIILCDQPFVSSLLLKELVAQKEATAKGIVACAYKETVGVPALFSKFYFTDLLSLTGSEGAKKIIHANRNDTTIVLFPQGDIDIDTKEQYENLIRSSS